MRQQHAGTLAGLGIIIDQEAGKLLVALLVVDELLLDLCPRDTRLRHNGEHGAQSQCS
jgi:hypothetical protein